MTVSDVIQDFNLPWTWLMTFYLVIAEDLSLDNGLGRFQVNGFLGVSQYGTNLLQCGPFLSEPFNGLPACCEFIPQVVCLLDVRLVPLVLLNDFITGARGRVDQFVTSHATLLELVPFLKLFLSLPLSLLWGQHHLTGSTRVDPSLSLLFLLSHILHLPFIRDVKEP